MDTRTDKKHGRFIIILLTAVSCVFIFYFVYNRSEPEHLTAENNLASQPVLLIETEPENNMLEYIPQYEEQLSTEPVNSEPESIIPETEPVTEPEPGPEPELRIRFTGTGDNVVHELIWIDAKNRAVPGGREYNFKPVYSDVAGMIADADIAFINQETPMAGSSFELSGYPLFNSPQDLGHDLVELGFDIINIANNHMIDKGETGLINTVNFLRSLDTMLIGDYLSRDELDQIKIIERGGIKAAFLAYTYGTNGLSLPAGAQPVIPYINDELIIKQVAKAKESADTVIISVHWGPENIFVPSSEQRRVAQLMADQGVLAIIGHHPHVLQPIEWITGSGGGRTLCVYSLGNFASGMILPANMIGGFISFDIVKRGSTVTLESPVFTPTIYYYAQNWLNGHVYLLEDYTPELAASHGTQTRHEHRRTVDELWGYVTRNISAEFLKPRN